MQSPLRQSLLVRQFLPSWQPSQLAPQSTSLSVPLGTPSVQVAATHWPSWHTPLSQSLARLHFWSVVHFLSQLPPQSTSDSEPSRASFSATRFLANAVDALALGAVAARGAAGAERAGITFAAAVQARLAVGLRVVRYSAAGGPDTDANSKSGTLHEAARGEIPAVSAAAENARSSAKRRRKLGVDIERPKYPFAGGFRGHQVRRLRQDRRAELRQYARTSTTTRCGVARAKAARRVDARGSEARRHVDGSGGVKSPWQAPHEEFPANFPRRSGAAAARAPALAEDTDELKQARAQFQQATELERAGNWAAALQRFREVGQVRMTPQVRFHIAVCEENLGRLVAALGGYELALAEADTVGPDFRTEVEQSIVRLRARIRSSSSCAAKGRPPRPLRSTASPSAGRPSASRCRSIPGLTRSPPRLPITSRFSQRWS